MPIWKFDFKHHPIAQWDSAREGCGRSRVQSPVSPMIFSFPQILHLSKSQITFVIVGSNPIFPHTKWVKTLVKIFKNEIFQKMLRIFWFIQKIENLKVNVSPYKMGQNTCKNFQKWNLSRNAQNLRIYPKHWKSQSQFFPIYNESKHL